ncbi:fibrobacter succinogenes major paralogous domain-containing protein [Aurantibacter crassamenti]|uniref:fibrobacter succinogenes major paralogous domain-containing protein n=1 Tax=Aurantibacter crassamenti TaxID=1837375 RepID=UPI001939FFC8|nr:fibrobacter succinogenes major paralogous domain-containing protein [Aurantibacter crassamenti]MBM1104511.1 fibrobacter succinogenes major paralogous domain-containing protein [Aurantibacter crassamenti]
MICLSLNIISTGCTKDDKRIKIPVIITSGVEEISHSKAISGGEIISDGGEFITAKGICWSSSKNPTVLDNKTDEGEGLKSFSSEIEGLMPNTTYYVRSYASNSSGIGYGDVLSFTTLEENTKTVGEINFNPNVTYGTMSDIDGNKYKTIEIGTQVWMAENLRVSKYNDGTDILLIDDEELLSDLTSPAYYWYYNYELEFKNTYGALYNWYAVNTGKLAPTGWHVPTYEEWETLLTSLDYIGNEYEVGLMLRETGITHWTNNNNEQATNESGFTALPGGYYGQHGGEQNGEYGFWWSSTEDDLEPSPGLDWAVGFHLNTVFINPRMAGEKVIGFSVRCVKD